MDNNFLERYAKLIVKSGINIQKNQILVISSPIECAFFTRKIAEIAYKEGAKDVVINWGDELFSKIRFLNAPEEVFEEFPDWQKEFFLSYDKKGAAFLSISASDPEIMKDVDPERILKYTRTRSAALAEHRERMMSNKNVWSVISVPTKAWAKKVFPTLSEDEAVDKLWEYIFKAVRADKEDPVAAWEEHKNNLKNRMDFLNNNNFKYLKYKNSLGTDLEIELPEGHIWLGGSDYTPERLEFIANIPTEEVFTLPKKNGVNGTVVSSMPLNENGSLVENFSLTFKEGKVVDFKAEKGYDTLKNIIETDEGSSYLGEVALVPYDSPISNLKTIFFNTLFDENASCHLALGNAYPVCIKGGENMSKEELEEKGVNSSFSHVDFMIGTEDLEIIGITSEGKEIPVFKNGNFAF
jgi:aminopeptidase